MLNSAPIQWYKAPLFMIRPLFRGYGRNQKIILLGFGFKWDQENLLLELSDLYHGLKVCDQLFAYTYLGLIWYHQEPSD